MPMIHLQQYVLERQAKIGRPISVSEIAAGSGLSRDTVNRLLKHNVTRADERTIFALCKFFDVPKGKPIPFLIYDPDFEIDRV